VKGIQEDALMDDYDRLLTALRRIIRVTDLNAKRLAKETGLTTPQFLILQSVESQAKPSVGAVAKDVNLTQATVTSIVDRLESQNLVSRRRSDEDRRIVHVELTDVGQNLLKEAPKVLQDSLRGRYDTLEDWEKSFLIAALDRMSALLQADNVDASPILDVGSVTRNTDMKTK